MDLDGERALPDNRPHDNLPYDSLHDRSFGDLPPDSWVPGIVVAHDGPMASVLVGVDQEQWDFPVGLLPADAEPGRLLRIGLVNGRPSHVEIDLDAELIQPRNVDDRLARMDRFGRRTAADAATGAH